MKKYTKLNHEELMSVHAQVSKEYERMKALNVNLNMARGKPDFEQIHLSLGVLDTVDSHYPFGDRINYCNYGILDGIDEAKQFFANILETTPDQVIVYGNSSLTIMFDQISRGYTHGYLGNKPWCQLDKIKFLCPVPGYDRHFAITEHFGFEMINIPMDENGPDMDLVEEYVNNDESVKGIWCVPQYSNPTGVTYSDEVVQRFAHLKPAAKDFRIFWDNAYVLHHLHTSPRAHVMDILKACKDAGNPNLVFEFCSTSKVTLPGAGVAAMATSLENKADILKHMSIQCIGHDKINQLRHIELFKRPNSLNKHMEKQARLLRPKFDTVSIVLSHELSRLNIATWTKPLGGYFVSFNAMEGCAKEIVKRCQEAGVTLTSAGATYPYGKDPHDSNIRLAPSYLPLDDLQLATEIFTICVKLVSLEKLMEQKA